MSKRLLNLRRIVSASKFAVQTQNLSGLGIPDMSALQPYKIFGRSKSCFGRTPRKPNYSRWLHQDNKQQEQEEMELPTNQADLRHGTTHLSRVAHNLSLAVHEGASEETYKLRQLLKESHALEAPKNPLSNVFHGHGQFYEPQKCLLQMRYQGKVFLICAANIDNIQSLQRELTPLVRRFGVGFVSAMHKFKNCGYIEAVISPRKGVNFSELEHEIALDAVACGAKRMEIKNYERGTVSFHCNPLELTEVCKNVEIRGYRVLNTEYGFSALRKVELTPMERSGYERFLKRLLQIEGMEEIYDNVKHVEQRDGNFTEIASSSDNFLSSPAYASM